MDEDRFDRLTKALNTSASRRLALRGLVAALVANLSHIAPIGTLAITRGSGGSGNRAIVGGGGRRRRHDPNNRKHHRKRKDRKCRPKSGSTLCQGTCDRVVGDGCGGKVDCTCKGGTVCAPVSGVCCLPGRLCSEKRVCCAEGEVCGPGDECCPSERACFPSNVCCPAGRKCTEGGGTCCLLKDVCGVGGVNAACCEGVNQQCVNGECIFVPPSP
jgi:hypothetical protein